MHYIVMFTANNGTESYLSTLYGMEQPTFTSQRDQAHRFASIHAAAAYLGSATEGNEDEQALVCNGDETVEFVPLATPAIQV